MRTVYRFGFLMLHSLGEVAVIVEVTSALAPAAMDLDAVVTVPMAASALPPLGNTVCLRVMFAAASVSLATLVVRFIVTLPPFWVARLGVLMATPLLPTCTPSVTVRVTSR